MFIKRNPNRKGSYVGDCVIRALSIALDQSWDTTYVELAVQGFIMADMPSSNKVWGELLEEKGFTGEMIKRSDYTVRDFCRDHPSGSYVLGTGSHVIAVKNGDYYDTWDSGEETPVMYWRKL